MHLFQGAVKVFIWMFRSSFNLCLANTLLKINLKKIKGILWWSVYGPKWLHFPFLYLEELLPLERKALLEGRCSTLNPFSPGELVSCFQSHRKQPNASWKIESLSAAHTQHARCDWSNLGWVQSAPFQAEITPKTPYKSSIQHPRVHIPICALFAAITQDSKGAWPP